MVPVTSIDNGSQFQPEVAKTLNLRPGEMRTVSFMVEVPQALPANSSFCGTVYAADLGFGHLFLPDDNTTVFCSAKRFDDVVWPLPLEKARSLQSHLAGLATGAQTPR